MYAYPEKTLQLEATAWMKRHWDYVELLSDVEATGDRMDSIGLRAGQPLAMEVKTSISSGMIRFAANRSGSLEAKLAAFLRALYDPHSGDRQAGAFRMKWASDQRPTIAFLARSYSDSALGELAALLDERQRSWGFDYLVLQWTNGRIEILREFTADAPLDRQEALQNIPVLKGGQTRRKALSDEEMRRLADESGIAHLLAELLECAEAMRLQKVRQIGGLMLKRPAALGGESLASVYFSGSSRENGLSVGINLDALRPHPGELPGVEAPRQGFMNTNRRLRSKEEIQGLFRLFRG